MTRADRRGRRTTRSRRRARTATARAILFPGHAEDRLGVHLMECRAYAIAERCFRHAISLNPAEPQFKLHLAHSLYQQSRYDEATDILRDVLRTVPDCSPAVRLLGWCAERLTDAGYHGAAGGPGAPEA